MRIEIEINMENEAFTTDNGNISAKGPELARILKELATEEENSADFEAGDGGKLFDANGNHVGQWRISEP